MLLKNESFGAVMWDSDLPSGMKGLLCHLLGMLLDFFFFFFRCLPTLQTVSAKELPGCGHTSFQGNQNPMIDKCRSKGFYLLYLEVTLKDNLSSKGPHWSQHWDCIVAQPLS